MSIIEDAKTNQVFGETTDIQRGLIPTEDDPDKKIYLVLYQYVDNGDDESNRHWELKQGRQDTFDFLKNLVVSETIDPNNSYILAEMTHMQDMGTVIGFLEAMVDNNLVVNDNDAFDPYDYDIAYEDSED